MLYSIFFQVDLLNKDIYAKVNILNSKKLMFFYVFCPCTIYSEHVNECLLPFIVSSFRQLPGPIFK